MAVAGEAAGGAICLAGCVAPGEGAPDEDFEFALPPAEAAGAGVAGLGCGGLVTGLGVLKSFRNGAPAAKAASAFSNAGTDCGGRYTEDRPAFGVGSDWV